MLLAEIVVSHVCAETSRQIFLFIISAGHAWFLDTVEFCAKAWDLYIHFLGLIPKKEKLKHRSKICDACEITHYIKK